MQVPHFSGAASTGYRDRALRQVPGLDGLHRMSAMLLAETMPESGRLLVLGAGGGLELDAFARSQPGWSFDGVDPSPEMLEAARQFVIPHGDRVRLYQGYAADAPEGPFDGATALLTFHFIARDERLATLRELHRRLRPGAPLILAHISFAQHEPERSMWIARHVAFGAPDATDPASLAASRAAIGTHLSILSPEDEEAMLREAGFSRVCLFYAALSFRGWVAYSG